MAFKLAELFVDITGRAGPLNAALGGVRSKLAALPGLAGKVGTGMARGFGQAEQRGRRQAEAAVAAGLRKSVLAASDLNKTVSKTEQVFHDSATPVLAAADEMAKKYGMVKREFLDAASMFGLIARGAGQAEGAASQVSVELARLAADASSFYNTSMGVALEKISAGLRGEPEPLRAFGVMLDEAKTKAKAAALGFKDYGDAAKFAARVAIIKEGLAPAAGDLDKTFHGFAIQSRRLWGNFENLAAEAGDALMPLADAVLGLANGALAQMGEVIRDNKDTIKAWATGAAEWIKQVVGAAARFGTAMHAFFKSTRVGEGVVAVLSFLGKAFGAVTKVVVGAVGVISRALEGLAAMLDVLFEAVGLGKGGGNPVAGPAKAMADAAAAAARAPAAAKADEFAAKAQASPPGKGETHSLADFYHKLREGAFRKEDTTNKQIAANTEATVAALGEVKQAIQQKRPGVAVAAP